MFKRICSIVLLLALCLTCIAAPLPVSAAEGQTQSVIDYMADLGDEEPVRVWVYLTAPDTEELEAMVKERVSDELPPQEYYEARLKVVREIYSGITASFAETYLDDSCAILYQSKYTAVLIIRAPKAKVLELAKNETVTEISLYEQYELLPQGDAKLSAELEKYLATADAPAAIRVWVYLTAPGTEELEAMVKERVSDELPPQEYYEARLKVIKEIYSGITGTFVEKYLDGSDNILYQSHYAAMLVIEARSAKILELAKLDEVEQIDLYTDHELLPAANFSDVQESDYYYNSVLWAYTAQPQITAGTDETHFSPNKSCTRAEAVTFLWRASGCPAPKEAGTFADVAADAWYAAAVQWAKEQGITTGTGENTFSPNNVCSRAQIVAMLWRAAGEPEAQAEVQFADVAADAYYRNAVAWAAGNGVTSGTSKTEFSPNKVCNRAEIVTFLYRACQKAA